ISGNSNISVSEFILTCLKESEQKDFIGAIFTLIYLVTLFGNLMVMLLIMIDQQLQRPMYLCIVVLSVIDLTCSTTIVLKILAILLFNNVVIPHNACFVQLFILQYMETLEIFLLSLMAFDRFVAINNPLRYSTVMTNKTILASVVALNVLGIVFVGIFTVFVASFSFCSTNILPYCFCDLTAMLSIACFEDARYFILTSSLGAFLIVPTFVIIVFSYMKIITAALKTPNRDGKRKAVSTCFTHLSIVGLFYTSLFFYYVIPASAKPLGSTFSGTIMMVSVVLPPMLNPLIYTFRNKEIKQSIVRIIVRKKAATL
uniref:Olfactory receptor n=1 Tax=Erpetoichthys calabaricus TaxID=27687 RepID=A0A8C4SR01_ERPCA